MLGARARAAEYKAFKAATARQASRDAEEQNLPPKPSPISLSAFTKNPLPNRNKGNKTWVPLILEDPANVDIDPHIDDIDSVHPEHDGMSTPTPSRQASHASSQSISSTSRPQVPPVRDLPSAHINVHDASTWATRRSHLKHQEYSAPLLIPIPQRPLPHLIVQQSQPGFPANLQGLPGNSGLFSLYPYPHQLWSSGLHSFATPAQVPIYPSSFAPQHNAFMVPDDISPAKQENKLANLSRTYNDSPISFGPIKQPFPATPILDNEPVFPQYTSVQYDSAPPGWNHPQHNINETGRPSQSSSFQHNVAESFTPLHEPASNVPAFPGFCPASISPEEPYDRESNMQNFVAAQQALARTGKTVLHNPNLHRNTSEGYHIDTLNTDKLNTASEKNPPNEPRKMSIIQKPLPFVKPPPGLESQHPAEFSIPSPKSPTTTSKVPSKGGIFSNGDSIPKVFDIDSSDWLDLRPVTKLERTWMNRMIRSCSRVEDIDEDRGLNVQFPAIRCDNLDIQGDDKSPSTRMARKALNRIANDYFVRRLSQLTTNDGSISSSDSARAKIETASIGAIGDILVNIRSSSDLHGSDKDDIGYFCKYKPAPEYAIERGRMMAGNAGSSSFFEEDTGGFYNAPSRIARDPRFRPASKEGLKSKVDDEWKLRHDIYGRRRL
ncbi:hypothetical protein LTR84_001132 [Exophiala bonariae]|uniref:Uncharacterized protein n=1 Tax=Exophiala bonariae TaxID=1690606 RepID=A0AAV9NSJ5_9EURO|nr:hypothetical protein LTR84_001132 [Exophiala bonariae]